MSEILPDRSFESRAEETSVRHSSDESKIWPDRWLLNHSLSGSRTSNFTMIPESRYTLPSSAVAVLPNEFFGRWSAMNRLAEQECPHSTERFAHGPFLGRHQARFRFSRAGNSY